MRVFVTGATGFIGSAVVRELIDAGHQVLGLVHSDASAAAMTRLGGEVHRGELTDTESLAVAAQACEGAIHLGFIHGAMSFADAMAPDRLAIETIGTALAGTGRPFVATSGTVVLTSGRLGTEDDAGDPNAPAGFRFPSEELALSLASQGVRACVVRPAPSVHGGGDKGLIPTLIALARKKGVSAYVGDGLNRWPAVHLLDAAHLFRLALENGTAGARYHAVGDEGVPFREIAEVIGRRLNVPVVAKSPDEASDHFGWLTFVVVADNPASNARTQQRLDWHPVQPGLIADLEEPHYFRS